MRRCLAIVIAGVAAMLIAAALGAGSAVASRTPAQDGRAVDDPGVRAASKHLSPRVRRQLRKAHRLLRHGRVRKARRVGRRIRKRKREPPPCLVIRPARCLCSSLLMAGGLSSDALGAAMGEQPSFHAPGRTAAGGGARPRCARRGSED